MKKQNGNRILIYFLLISLISSPFSPFFSDVISATAPTISFIAPTPDNGYENTISIPVSISSTGDPHYTFTDFNADNLLWLRMDYVDGSGFPLDNSTYGNDVNAKYGSITQSSVTKYGNTIWADGNGDSFNIPTSASMDKIGNTTTISFWAKMLDDYGAFPSSSRGFIRFHSGPGDYFFLAIRNTGKLSIGTVIGGFGAFLDCSNTFAPGFITDWHHYTFIFTSTDVKTYIDGSYNGTGTWTSYYKSLGWLPDGFYTRIGMGTSTAGNNTLHGYMDEVLFFNRTFVSDEILSLYNATVTQYSHDFTGLAIGNYTFRGSSVALDGSRNDTETRWRNLTEPSAPAPTVSLSPNISFVSPTPTNGTYNQTYFDVNITSTGNEIFYNTTITLHPTGDASVILFPVGAANNYDCVDETISDGDTTRVQTYSSAPQQDIYRLQNISKTGAGINYIDITINATRSGMGTSGNQVNALLSINGTVYYNSAQTLTTPYQEYVYRWETNPATSSNWTWTDINDLQIGVWFDINGLSTYGFCTQEYLTVNFSTNSHHYTFLDVNNDTVLWMLMENISGTTVYDNSTYANDGTGVFTQTTESVFGEALDFDGATSYVDIPTDASLNNLNKTATISFWANSSEDFSSFPQTSRGLLRFRYNNTNRLYINLVKTYVGSDQRKLAVADALGSSPSQLFISNDLGTDYITRWHHYAIVFNETYVSGYIDGIYKGSSAFTSAIPDLSYLLDGFTTTIGQGSGSGASNYGWHGQIDDLLISTREYKPDEILSLYEATTNQFNHNYTNMMNNNYTITGWAVNTYGLTNHTETRWINLSKKYEPTITLISPSNGSINQKLWTDCIIQINDLNTEETFTLTFQEDTTGSWITRQVTTDVSIGEAVTWVYEQAATVNTTYYWRVYVNDSVYNISETYFFTTADHYYVLKGLTNEIIDWSGLPGSSYWCNETGSYAETMEINITGGTNGVYNVSIWVGNMFLSHNQTIPRLVYTSVTFADWAIEACKSNLIQDVFQSVWLDLLWVTNYDNTTNWYRNRDPSLNTLNDIQPDTLYYVLLGNRSTLQINTDINIEATNISAQFSSDNSTWGTNTQSFTNNGSTLILNSSAWTTANGCYGANPFIGNFITSTGSIFCRFNLTLPLTIPHNHSYTSLSASNWKVYIMSTGTTPPSTIPFYTSSLPPTGHFLLKYDIDTWIENDGATPIAVDIDNNGYMEIFHAGRNTSTLIQRLICINGTTGENIWETEWSWSGPEPTRPIGVYDFDKDGTYEVFVPGLTQDKMFNAETGTVEWTTSHASEYGGNHQFAWIDHGDIVYIYVSGHDSTYPYDGKIRKIYGNNGSTIVSTEIYYSCNGGTSIADLNNDGKYEILVTDRGQDFFPGTTAKSVRCYDEDLNLIWYAGYPTVSSHCAMLVDVDGDGDLEVVVGRENISDSLRCGLYVYNYDGSIWKSEKNFTGVFYHNQMSCGDIDGDGHIEVVSGVSPGVTVFDITDWTIDYTSTESVSYVPTVGNVILDSGLTDNKLEIIGGTSTQARIFEYNTTTFTWGMVTSFTQQSKLSFVNDFDHDGYNELMFQYTGGLSCYETKVPTTSPQPRTNSNWYGERRLNNGEYYTAPFYDNPIQEELSFGGYATTEQLSADTFITNCTSQHNLIELNGNYNLGNYSTNINTTLYLPSPWDIDTLYVQLINDTGAIYDNITTGFTQTTINATHKQISKLYNPSNPMTGTTNISCNVFATIKYDDATIFSNFTLFTDVFKIYDIDAPFNGLSRYDTLTNALNLTWSAGNYTDMYAVVKKSGVGYPSSPSDGTIMQNSSNLFYEEAAVLASGSYAVFGYNISSNSFSEALNIPWGAIAIDVRDENNASNHIWFNLLISSKDGSQTYTKNDIVGTYYLDLFDIPYGPQTIFILSNSSYRQRKYYEDLYVNTFYNFTFYLPPVAPGGGTTPEENLTQLYLFTVYNRYGQTLQNVKIDVRRYINVTDSYESIGILNTDAAGQDDIFLIPYKLYQFVVSKNGFITTTSYWTPTPLIQTHTFILDFEISTEPSTIDPHSVISFTAGFPLNNVTLTVDVDDSTNNLTDATIYIYENGFFIYSIDFFSTPFHLDYTHNSTSPNNNLSEYIVVLCIRNHSEFPGTPGAYNFTIIIQKSNPHGLLLDIDLDITEYLGDPGSGAGVHIGWINIFLCGVGVFVIVSFGRYWVGIALVALGFVIGLVEFLFGLPGFTGIQLVSFIAYCIIMGALVEIGKAKQGRIGY